MPAAPVSETYRDYWGNRIALYADAPRTNTARHGRSLARTRRGVGGLHPGGYGHSNGGLRCFACGRRFTIGRRCEIATKGIEELPQVLHYEVESSKSLDGAYYIGPDPNIVEYEFDVAADIQDAD